MGEKGQICEEKLPQQGSLCSYDEVESAQGQVWVDVRPGEGHFCYPPPPPASLSQEVESGVNAAAAMFKPAEHPC